MQVNNFNTVYLGRDSFHLQSLRVEKILPALSELLAWLYSERMALRFLCQLSGFMVIYWPFLYTSSSVRTSCMWFPGSLSQLSPGSQWNRLLCGPVEVAPPTAAWLAGVAALSSSISYHSHLKEHMLFLRILVTGFMRKFYARCLFQW